MGSSQTESRRHLYACYNMNERNEQEATNKSWNDISSSTVLNLLTKNLVSNSPRISTMPSEYDRDQNTEKAIRGRP